MSSYCHSSKNLFDRKRKKKFQKNDCHEKIDFQNYECSKKKYYLLRKVEFLKKYDHYIRRLFKNMIVGNK